MSTAATDFALGLSPKERLEVLFGEMEELAGQRNAIDSRLVEIVAEIDGDGIWGATGARSVPALVAWKLGTAPRNAETIVAVARRLEEFPRCAAPMREGQLSLDQVGVIAERAADGSDEHYAQLASVATVTQLRTAIKLEPRPDPEPEAGAGAVDQQDRRRDVYDVADPAAAGGGREVRRRPAVASRRVGRGVETRPRGADDDRPRRRPAARGRGHSGRCRRSRPPSTRS